MTSKKQRKVPELRFRGFTDDWEQRKLSSIVTRVTRKNTGLVSDLPLTISAQDGLVDQVTYFNKRVASKNMEHYLLLLNGEFAYNKSYSKDYPWGAIKRLDMYPRGALSTLYIAFKPTSVNSEFLVAYYETSNWYKQVSERAAEGARNHGLLNIAPHDFFDTRLLIPKTDDEQRSIGLFIKKLDHTIALHQRKQSLLEKLKQGYLQKLFPQKGQRQPELRFSGFTDDWEQRKLGNITESFSGGTPSVTNSAFYGGAIPFIRSAEIHSDTTELSITEEAIKSSSAKMVHKGDILYALYGATSGQTDLSKIDGAINQAILALRPTKNVHSEYLVQWLAKEKETIISRYLQGGQGNLSASIVKQLIIPMSVNELENKAIGNLFQHLDDVIALHQQEIDRLQQLKQGYLQKMFV